MTPKMLFGASVTLAFMLSAVPAQAADITSNLVLHYSFDNPANLGADSSGNGYTGILVGSSTIPVAATTSIKGGAAFFNKAGYSGIVAPPAAKLGASYTKSAWAYISTNAGSGTGIISHPTKLSKQHVLMQYSTTNIWTSNNHALPENRIAGTITRNKWSHLVTTYDAPTQTLKLYIDGVLSGTLTGAAAVPETEREIMVGAYATNSVSRTFDGPLDEVRVYSRALSAEDVTALYQFDQSIVPPPPVEQHAPTASAVSVSGTAMEGSTLTGSYTYADQDGDAEGATTVRWLSAASANSTFTAITGAITPTYQLTNADVGKVVAFEVTPRAATGTIEGLPVRGAAIEVTGLPVVASSTPTPAQDVTSGIVLHYAFDSASNLGLDSSGNGYTGVLAGTTTPVAVATTSIKESSAYFNRNGFSSIIAPAAAQLGASYTKSVWALVSQNNGGGGGLISHPTKLTQNHTIMQTGIATIIAANAYSTTLPKITETVDRYVWTHLAVTYDASSRSLKLYRNGTLSSTVENVDPVAAADRGLMIGAMATSGATKSFGGHLDEVRVYTRALTPEQVSYLYNLDRTVIAAPVGVVAQGLNQRVRLSIPEVSEADDYVVEYRPVTASTFSVFADSVGTPATIDVTGLTNGVVYQFRVTAVKNGVQSAYSNVVSATPGIQVETAPVALEVMVSGTPFEGQTLIGSYTYFDANEDDEAASTVRWLRATSTNSIYTAIPGATEDTYVVTEADANRYLAFEVTPKAHTGINTGVAARSAGTFTQARTRYFHVLSAGQSLSLGGGPALSTSQPYTNVSLTILRDAEGNAYDVAPFIPLKAVSTERPDIPASNTYAGLTITNGKEVSVISSSHGIGGSLYTKLKKGTEAYARGINQATVAKAEADAMNGVYEGAAVMVIHGEADSLNRNANYDQNLIEWRNDYNADISSILGREAELPFFFSQTSQTAPAVGALEQLQAERSENPYMHLVGPIYQYSFNYPDYVHLNGNGSRDLGEQFGKVMHDVLVRNSAWKPLMPISITRTGTDIFVKYHVPVGPLVFDTTQVAERASKGFVYYVNNVQKPISSVEIVAPDTVRIQIPSVATGTEELSYGINPAFYNKSYGDPNDSAAHGGNLRDSDSRVAPGSTSSGKPLYNWAVTFRDPVIVSQ